MKLTEAQWAVMEVLWTGPCFSLKEIADRLKTVNGWSKNTVFTYLTRLAEKGMVTIDRSSDKPYRAALSREACAREERSDLLKRVYGGAAGDLIAAFLKESSISPKEIQRLKKLLEDMEV